MDFDPRDFDDSRDRIEDLRDRERDPRDVFTRELDLPQGREREIVRDRDREYTLRGSESRTLATVGAFRVVSVVTFGPASNRVSCSLRTTISPPW